MRRMILTVMILALILLAIAPALADSRPAPTPTPAPLFVVLEPGQTIYVLCSTGLHVQAFGKEAGQGVCDGGPSR